MSPSRSPLTRPRSPLTRPLSSLTRPRSSLHLRRTAINVLLQCAIIFFVVLQSPKGVLGIRLRNRKSLTTDPHFWLDPICRRGLAHATPAVSGSGKQEGGGWYKRLDNPPKSDLDNGFMCVQPPFSLSIRKIPPVAAARIAVPAVFPSSFTLTTADLTPEGAAQGVASFAATDLTVTMRLDLDGTASTRDPGDLVGQGALQKGGQANPEQWSPVTVRLQPRGVGGKLVTTKAK